MMYSMGILQQQFFEDEVRQAALQSQTKEGINDPQQEESNEVGKEGCVRCVTSLTDYYFSINHDFNVLEDIICESSARTGRGSPRFTLDD